MPQPQKVLNTYSPTTKADWLRWCAMRDMTFDRALEWLELQDYTLSLDEWDQEQWDFAQAINENFRSLEIVSSSNKREVGKD